MEEYDPTNPEIVKAEQDYERARPDSRRRLYELSLGNLFQTWPTYPLQVVRYGKYHLRWEYKEGIRRGLYQSGRKEAYPQISIDGKTWLDFDEVALDPRYSNNPKPKPVWWDKKELMAEIEASYKSFVRNRNRMLAQRRKEKLIKEAKEAGMDFGEFKAQRTEKNKKERKAKRRIRAGERLADELNRKIKLAMILKELADETAELRAKLEDETKKLDLTYIDNKVDKIRESIWTLRNIGQEQKK